MGSIIKNMNNASFSISHDWSKQCIVWKLFVVIIAINHGIQIDSNYKASKNKNNNNSSKYDEECWSNNKSLVVEDLLSLRNFEESEEPIKSNFDGDYVEQPETSKWLLSCLQSLILSIFYGNH